MGGCYSAEMRRPAIKSSSYRESRSPSAGLTTKIVLSSVTLTSVILNGKQRQGKVSSTKPSLPLLKTTYSHRWWMSPQGGTTYWTWPLLPTCQPAPVAKWVKA